MQQQVNLKKELKKLSKNEVIKIALQLSEILDRYIVNKAIENTEAKKEDKSESSNS